MGENLTKPPSTLNHTEAWFQMYEACYKSLLRYCLNRTKNRADAEDLAQETLLCLGKHLQKASIEPPMIGYAIAIARNLYLKSLRTSNCQSRQTHEPASDRDAPENLGERSLVVKASLEQYNSYVVQNRAIKQKQSLEEILKLALKHLPQEKRQLLLWWADVDDQAIDGCQVIAEELGQPRALVAYNLQKAKSALRYRVKQLLLEQR